MRRYEKPGRPGIPDWLVCGRRPKHPGRHESTLYVRARANERNAPTGSAVLAAALREAREQAGLSQRRLAAVVGVVTGAQTRNFASLELSTAERAEYYMGPRGEAWVRQWLADGWIGYACVFRVPDMAHAVAVLGGSEDGVLLMDPLSGHVTEPWGWFLGIGPGRYGCHYVESWYRP